MNTNTALSSETAARLRVLLGFLRAGRMLNGTSVGLLLGTVVLALGPASPARAVGVGGAVALGLLEQYLAWRVALDAEFFAWLLEKPAETLAFDAALAAFLGRAPGAAPRSMESRAHGARRLTRRQAAVLGMQAGAVAALAVASQLR